MKLISGIDQQVSWFCNCKNLVQDVPYAILLAVTDHTQILTGQTQEHIEWLDPKLGVHVDLVSPLNQLKKAALDAGFELTVCSGFRSFESQLSIWNGKASGLRPILDSQGKKLDISKMGPENIMFSILRWSALPGLSRHHWGTDLDVFDQRALPENYQLQLVSEEFEGEGYFAPLHDWLDKNLSRFGFFRPYEKDLGGVSPERWHISYAPLAQQYWKKLTLDHIRKVLSRTEFELKQQVEIALPVIYERFFLRITPP